MKAQTLFFTAPRQVEWRENTLPAPSQGEALARTLLSAPSPGTEMLVYRGQFPRRLAASADSISANLRYPLAYGYACVAEILQTGPGVDEALAGRLVFAFQPHTSAFVAPVSTLHLLPPGLPAEAAVFLPNMETAVSLTQDIAPLLGERGLALGQGIVGLLTLSLLKRFPLESLVSADRFPLRRQASLRAGAAASLDPAQRDFHTLALQALGGEKADFVLEISGAPQALNDALALTRFSGRIIIGSWYGQKRATLALGGDFHRSRIQLFASQVSAIRPELSGRWDKSRRFATTWRALEQVQPQQWVTHRFAPARAADLYRLLDESPQEALQPLIKW